jgi:hypothetical protein
MATRTDIYNDLITGDWTVENYDLRFVQDKAEFVAQKISEVLLTVLGEWFLDRSIGIPYFGTFDDFGRVVRESGIFAKNPDLTQISTIFQSKILGIDEVEDLIEFEIELENSTRTLTITFTVDIGENEPVTGTIVI